MTNVVYEQALALVRTHLRSLRDHRTEAEPGIARVIQQLAYSVSHAEAALTRFDHIFPTPAEVKTVLRNLEGQFRPPEPSNEERWTAEGCTRDSSAYQEIIAEVAKSMGVKGAPREIDLMWRAIKDYLKVKDFKDVPIGKCWYAAHELGFPLNSQQIEKMQAWRGTVAS